MANRDKEPAGNEWQRPSTPRREVSDHKTRTLAEQSDIYPEDWSGDPNLPFPHEQDEPESPSRSLQDFEQRIHTLAQQGYCHPND